MVYDPWEKNLLFPSWLIGDGKEKLTEDQDGFTEDYVDGLVEEQGEGLTEEYGDGFAKEQDDGFAEDYVDGLAGGVW